MKKIILILLSTLLVVGCNKKNTQPAPIQQAPPPAAVNTNSCTTYEQSLLGRWLADSHVIYSGNVRQYCIPQVDTNTCRINFYSTDHPAWSGEKNGDFGYLGCNLQAGHWKAPTAGIVTINGLVNGIFLQTATSLVLTKNGDRYYLHR